MSKLRRRSLVLVAAAVVLSWRRGLGLERTILWSCGRAIAQLWIVGQALALLIADDAPVALNPATLGDGEVTVAAIGVADPEPVYAPLLNPGLTRRPLSPVHGRVRQQADGTVALSWCRRSRGSWQWLDGVDAPLNEQTEVYVVGIGAVDDPSVRWNTAMPELTIAAPDWATLHAAHAGQPLWVRQVGTAALSPTLLLTTLD